MLSRLRNCTRRGHRSVPGLLLLYFSVVLMVMSRLPGAGGFLLASCSSSRASLLSDAHRANVGSAVTTILSWYVPRSGNRILTSSTAGSDDRKAEGDEATSDSILTTPQPRPSSTLPASQTPKTAIGIPTGKTTGATTAAAAAAVTKNKPQPAKLSQSKNLLIVGLGNPGKDYTMTRHNAGFLVIDELAKRMGVNFKLRSAFQGEYGSTTYQGKSIGLLKPTTYMNNSGQSVRKVLDYFKLPLSSVLVVVDEVALEMGQIRLRQTGSAGGHNGLKSIEGHLKSKDYNRLRIGVGGAAPGRMVDHVLGEFSRSERKLLDDLLMNAVEAVEDWIEDDNTNNVMTRVNAPR
ncbi:peptidyl-trna hydrolase [Nannochloropsis oceanica]